MTSKERYHTDEAYRKATNKRNNENYHKNMKDPLFAKTQATKARIHNGRASISHHEERAAFFYKRLEADLKLLNRQLASLAAKRKGKKA